MSTIKNLEWIKQDDDLIGFSAVPNGLNFRYSIIMHPENKIEFAILDHNLEYTAGSPQFYQSIDLAKDAANKHYLFVINQFFLL